MGVPQGLFALSSPYTFPLDNLTILLHSAHITSQAFSGPQTCLSNCFLESPPWVFASYLKMSHLTWDGSLQPSPLAGFLPLEMAPQGLLGTFLRTSIPSSTLGPMFKPYWLYLLNISRISPSSMLPPAPALPHTGPCVDTYLGALTSHPPIHVSVQLKPAASLQNPALIS